MSLIEKMIDPAVQNEYYEHYMKRADPNKNKTAAFAKFWKSGAVMPAAQAFVDNTFELDVPEQIILRGTDRECYVYQREQSFMLGFLAYVLKEITDASPGVYSGGRGGVHGFIHNHMQARKTPGSVVVRTDIRKFTKSIRRDVMIEVQRHLLKDDPQTLAVIERLLSRGEYTVKGETFTTERNIFMGTPLDSYVMNSVFYDADHMMSERCIHYARFYDDVAMVVANREEAEAVIEQFKQETAKLQLELHPKKTFFVEGDEPYELLGLVIQGANVGLSDKMMAGFIGPVRQQCKMVSKMVRQGKVPGNMALAKAVQEINFYMDTPRLKKMYEPFLDCITRVEDLKKFDHMVQDWLRVAASGTTSNAKYRVKYSDLKAAGYHSTVDLYYKRHPERRV